MLWIKELASNARWNILSQTNTLHSFMGQKQEGSQFAENVEKNTIGSTDLTRSKNQQGKICIQ